MKTTSSGDEYDPTTCIACGGEETRVVFQGPIVPVWKCASCGLMRQGQRVAGQEASSIRFSGGLERLREQRLDKEVVQLSDYQAVADELERLLPERGRLLEIGCATGVLLNDFRRRRWDVLGVEPEKWTCEIARSRYGLEVINACFQDAGIDAGSIDAVIMFHVIEHLPDPISGLEELWRMIRPGGYLVLETPRYDTPWFKILKGRERSVIPGHLFYFTRQSLRAIVERVGFDVHRVEAVGRTLTLDRLCYSISKVVNWSPVTRGLTWASDALELRKYRVHVNTRDMMRFYLRKPAAS